MLLELAWVAPEEGEAAGTAREAVEGQLRTRWASDMQRHGLITARQEDKNSILQRNA